MGYYSTLGPLALCLLLLSKLESFSVAFVLPQIKHLSFSSTRLGLEKGDKDVSSNDVEYLKEQLLEYLDKRREWRADEEAQKQVGKVIGGTKGNFVLNFVSGSPNKERVLEKAPDALDYGELTKYGFGHLVTPMMKAGGRFEMYRILELEAPETRAALKLLSSPEIVIDRGGKSDPKRYTGLKLGQVLDDSVQAAALEQAVAKHQEKDNSSSAIIQDYEMPFADKRNVAPKQTPDWTPALLDEWGKNQGRVESWARQARAAEIVTDSYESLDLNLQQRAYSILTILLIATAFGKSTESFLVDMVHLSSDQVGATALKKGLQIPALCSCAVSVGSMFYSFQQAKNRNRNSLVWSVMGLLGGPITVDLLGSLEPLYTREERRANSKESRGG